MCATVDRPARPLFRLVAAAGLVLMTIGLAHRAIASVHDAGIHGEAASRTSCDARSSDSCCLHPDHFDESDIPVVDAPDGLGPPRRLRSACSAGRTAAARRPPVRPPSA
jgi:hypothetical protein